MLSWASEKAPFWLTLQVTDHLKRALILEGNLRTALAGSSGAQQKSYSRGTQDRTASRGHSDPPAVLLLLAMGPTSSSKEIMAGSSCWAAPLPERADWATDASDTPGLCIDSDSLTSCCWLLASCLSGA